MHNDVSRPLLGLSRHRLAPLLLFSLVGVLGAAAPASAQGPYTVLHSVLNPGTNPQSGPRQGYSVAVDGSIAVTGAPLDDVGAFESGVAKVYRVPSGALLHTLINPRPSASDLFGACVAVSGMRVVVAAPSDDTGAHNAGSAYVYDLAGATPTLPVATLTNPSPTLGYGFAQSVAVSGTRVVVGAYTDATGVPWGGSAYVYDLTSGTPTLPVATLRSPNSTDDRFGISVAVSGTRVVVGADLNGFGGPYFAGAAYVYDLASATPTVPVTTLTNPSPVAYDMFGRSVAISGTRVVVGAFWDDTDGHLAAGSAYVYDLAGATPTVPVATLLNPSPAEYDFFGYSVAVSGARVVVGAYRDGTSVTNAGSAYVYDLASATPTVPMATLISPSVTEWDAFGYSVAVSGTLAVIGAYEDDTGAPEAGSAYVFDMSDATPTVPVARLNNSSPATDDEFGYSAALSGKLLVVGAPEDDTGALGAGSAYVFDLASLTPTTPVATLTNPSPAARDNFGYSVAASDKRVVVGAPNDTIGVFTAGSAFVYDLASATPTVPVVTLTNPSPASDDQFGSSVAISGGRVVVGARRDDTGALNSGSAYVYDLASATPTVPVVTLTNPSPAWDDHFGSSVAISGGRVVVGAPNDTGAFNTGSAFVYDLASAAPTVPVARLTNPILASDDHFGISVAISGTRVVVGAALDHAVITNTGSAHVFDLAGGTPTVPVAILTNPSTANPSPVLRDNFGYAVAISGTRVVVGSFDDDRGAPFPGSAFVYDLSSATPTVPVATLHKPGPASSFAEFGRSVAISGTWVVAGAPDADSIVPNRGAAYVFDVGPRLRIVPAGPGFVTLSWMSANSPGFVLQFSDSLAPANWLDAPSGAANPVTVPAANGKRFYRLFHP